MSRAMAALLLLLAAGEAGAAAPPFVRRDAEGVLMPAAAVARLGTLRLYHGAEVASVALSPDGKVLATGGGMRWKEKWGRHGREESSECDQRVRLWDRQTGKLLAVLEAARHEVTSLIFSPDGHLLVGAGVTGVQVWEVRSGKQLWRFDGQLRGESGTVGLDANGAILLAADCKGRIRRWDLRTGKTLEPIGPRFQEDDTVVTVRVREDGALAAFVFLEGLAERERFLVLDCRSGKGLGGRLGSTSSPFAFAAQEGLLARVGRTCQVWDITTKKLVGECYLVGGRGANVVLSADGSLLGSTSQQGPTQIHEVRTGKHRFDVSVLQRPRANRRGVPLTFSRDIKSLALASGATAFLLDSSSGKEAVALPGHRSPALKLDFSADGKRLISVSRDARCEWDTRAWKQVARDVDSKYLPNDEAVSPCGKRLAWSEGGRIIRLQDAKTGKALPLQSPTVENKGESGFVVVFSPDGQFLAALPSGRAATSTVRVWHVPSGRLSRRWSIRHGESDPGRPRCVAFSADGRTLATGHEGVRNIRMWEVATGRERYAFPAPKQAISALAFSPDGRSLVSAQDDNTLLVWDLALTRPRPARNADRRLWELLGDPDPARAENALAALSTADAIAFLAGRLKAVPKPDAREVARLLEDLDSEDFATRTTAEQRLAELGDSVEEALRLYKAVGLEAQLRVARLLHSLEPSAMTPERLREVRAIEALERTGNPEAIRLLRALAKGADGARLTREAKAALGRLALRKE